MATLTRTPANTASLRAWHTAGRMAQDAFYGRPSRWESMPYRSRTGSASGTFSPPRRQNQLVCRITVNPAGLGSGVTMNVAVEQSLDNATWMPVGGMGITDVLAALSSQKPGTQPNTLWLRFREQVYDHATFAANAWPESHDMVSAEAHYHQLAWDQFVRVTVDTSAPVSYSVDHGIERQPMPPVPLGTHSAALVGTSVGAETGGATSITSASKTTTAGNFLVVTNAVGNSVASINTSTDSKGNTYTEAIDTSFNGGSVRLSICYNGNAGTRGTVHTVTTTFASAWATIGMTEWSGIAASPTVDTNSATGTSAAPSGAITPTGGAALVLGVCSYDSIAGTIAVNSGTQAFEQDDNNDTQVQNVNYKVASSGSTTLSWTITSTEWGIAFAAFTEAVTAASLTKLPYSYPMPLGMMM